LNQQIETAIVSALQTAEQSGASTDFQTVIGNAVQQTLQANGIGGVSSTADTASTTSSNGTAASAGSSSTTASSNSLNQQIEAAIVSALQTAEQSGDATDFRTVIGNAVQQTLQANGIGGVSSTTDTASTTSSANTTNSLGSLNQQIETAIVSALQTAEQSGASTDFQTVIGNAVQQTLQANGIGGVSSTTDTASTTSSNGTTASAGSSSTTASSNSLNQQIEAAVVLALQTAEQSGASTDFRTVIGNAVQQTLQANGIGGVSSTANTASSTSSNGATANTGSSGSSASSDSTSTASTDQLIQLLQQLFGNQGSNGNQQLLGLLVDMQT
jgi:hypothetical protein